MAAGDDAGVADAAGKVRYRQRCGAVGGAANQDTSLATANTTAVGNSPGEGRDRGLGFGTGNAADEDAVLTALDSTSTAIGNSRGGWRCPRECRQGARRGVAEREANNDAEVTEITPLLLMPPEKVDTATDALPVATPPMRMPAPVVAPLLVMVPALLMPPPNVETVTCVLVKARRRRGWRRRLELDR